MIDEMEKQEIDYKLLQSLLGNGKKQIEKTEVSQILGLEVDDEEDLAVLDELMLILNTMGFRKYSSLKTVIPNLFNDHLSRISNERNFGSLALSALLRLREFLMADIPEEFLVTGGRDVQNVVEAFECLILPKDLSGIKLSDPRSSVKRGLIVDISLTKSPLTKPAHPTGTELMDFCIRKDIIDLTRLLTEGTYTMREVGYPFSMVPKFADATAKTVLSENYGRLRKFVVANPGSKPEFSAGIRLQGYPPKSDEWKSFPNEAIEELVQTSLGHIQSSYFREKEGAQSWRFCEKVPWGLAFLSCACSVVCVFSVEMVGVLLFSIYGGGCSVGTNTYEEYLTTLNKMDQQHAVVDLKYTELVECQTVGKKTQWTLQPKDGFFYKIIRYDLFHIHCCPEHKISRGENWRRLFDVYHRYSTINLELLPSALIPDTLLYGEFQVGALEKMQ
jgi:hypothetical protein